MGYGKKKKDDKNFLENVSDAANQSNRYSFDNIKRHLMGEPEEKQETPEEKEARIKKMIEEERKRSLRQR